MAKVPKAEVDSRDELVLRYLAAHPTAEPAEVSQATEIPVSTLHKRLRHLAANGLIVYQTLVTCHPFPTRAMVTLKVERHRLQDGGPDYHDPRTFAHFLREGLLLSAKARGFAEVILIERVEIMLGGVHDFMLLLSASRSEMLWGFVADVLRDLEGVTDTHTTTIFDSRDLHRSAKKTK